jgi:hypothetical protein
LLTVVLYCSFSALHFSIVYINQFSAESNCIIFILKRQG